LALWYIPLRETKKNSAYRSSNTVVTMPDKWRFVAGDEREKSHSAAKNRKRSNRGKLRTNPVLLKVAFTRKDRNKERLDKTDRQRSDPD
jgi:hypothetical protein